MAQAEVTKDATDGVGDAHVSSFDAVGSGRDLRHLADVQNAPMNVRFEGNNEHDADVTRCLLMTLCGPHEETPYGH